jgi:hypothetical protein
MLPSIYVAADIVLLIPLLCSGLPFRLGIVL